MATYEQYLAGYHGTKVPLTKEKWEVQQMNWADIHARRLRPRIETQESINAWQGRHFPDATSEGVVNHLKEEFQEFLTENDKLETAVEAADLVILLYAWAGKHGLDLHAAIDAKMKINRSREWTIQEDGTRRHK
jgi:NTP pyrophosphatase (non-canonical NTP hydrolase)